MSLLSSRSGIPMSDYDRKLVKAAGFGHVDVFLPSHDAAPVYTDRYARLILALEGDKAALASLELSHQSDAAGNGDGDEPH
jgi:hypothetical protein